MLWDLISCHTFLLSCRISFKQPLIILVLKNKVTDFCILSFSFVALPDDGDLEDLEGWEYIEVPNRKMRIAVSTMALEQKKNAMNMIYIYASNMKAGFFPYVGEAMRIVTENMDNPYHDGLQLAALSAYSHLLNSAKLYEIETGNVRLCLFLSLETDR